MVTDPNTSQFAAFRAVGGTDTTWKCYTSDGAASTVTDSTVSIVDGTPVSLQIVFNGGTSIQFYVNGVLRQTHTTHLPATTTNLTAFWANTCGANTVTHSIHYYMWWMANN